MNEIEKMLLKFTDEERMLYRMIVQKLEERDTIGLNIKKLRGFRDIYRVRKRKVRIIFKYGDDGHVKVLTLDRRSEDTYRRY